MSYQERIELAQSHVFIMRVMFAMMVQAVNVLEQAIPDPAHLALAQDVVKEPERYAIKFAYGVATNLAVSDSSTDAEIQTATNAILLAYAK